MPYAEMMQVLQIQDVRQLEDKIIDCIYNDLLKGRLDQKNNCLHVSSTFGRDVQDSAMNSIVERLQDWDRRLAGAQTYMEAQMENCQKNVHTNFTNQVASEINYQKSLAHAISREKKDADRTGGAEGQSSYM